MKYIKNFENINKKPEVGDYVILSDNSGKYNSVYVEFSNFINTNIGRIIKIKVIEFTNLNTDVSYDIEYENIPDKLKNLFTKKIENGKTIYYNTSIPESDIIYTSKSKTEVDMYLNTIKYNL